MKQCSLIKSILAIFLLSFSCACTSIGNNSGKIRLGYLLNVAHAVPIIGLEKNALSDVDAKYFMSGGYLLNSLMTGNLDMAYLGPGPIINAISKGIELKILSGSSMGGNSFVIAREYIDEFYKKNYDDDASCMLGSIKKIAVPQYGNTQDLILRIIVENIPNTYDVELGEDYRFSEDLEIIPVNPSELETTFFTRSVDAALVQEPWGTMLAESGARLVKPEDCGDVNDYISCEMARTSIYPAALLVVSTAFAEQHPEKVQAFLKEQSEVMKFLRYKRIDSIPIIKSHFDKSTGKDIEEDFLKESMEGISFSSDLDKDLMKKLAQAARKAKYIKGKLNLAKKLEEDLAG